MSIYNDLIPKDGNAPKLKEEGFLKKAARAVLPESIETKIVGPKPQPKMEAPAAPASSNSIYKDLLPKKEAEPEAPVAGIYSDLVPKKEKSAAPKEEGVGVLGTAARTIHSAVLDIGKSFFTGLRAVSEGLSGEGKPLIRADETTEKFLGKFREGFKAKISQPIIEKTPGLEFADKTIQKTSQKIKNLVLSPISENSKAAIKALDEKQLEVIRPIFDDKPGLSNVNEYLHTIGSGAISMAEAVGLTLITKNPGAAAGFLSFLEASPNYNEARDTGADPSSALKTATKSGIGTFILEKMGLDYLFGLHGGSTILNGLKAAAFETAQEEIQTLWQNLVRKTDIDKATNIFEGMWETAVGTAIPSFIVGLILPGVDLNIRKELVNKLQKEGGLSKTEATKTAAVMEEMVHETKQTFQTTRPSVGGEAIKEENISMAESQKQFEEQKKSLEGKTIEEIVAERQKPKEEILPIQETSTIPVELEPLAQEARKYKTEEEWVKSYSENLSNEASPIKDNIIKDFGIRKGDLSKAETVKKIGDIEIKRIEIPLTDSSTGKLWQEKYVFAIDKKGNIIGAADGQKSLTENNLLRIAVDKEFRNKGIGTELSKAIGGMIEPRAFDTDLSLAGLKTFLKSQGTSLTDFYNQAVKNVNAPSTTPIEFEDISAPLQQKAEADWADNYAEKYGELQSQSMKLVEEIKTAKKSEVKKLDKQRQEIDLELAAMEQGFLDKYQPEIEKVREEVKKTEKVKKEKSSKREVPTAEIQKLEEQLRAVYSKNQNEATEKLAELLMELELSEAGERAIIKDESGWVLDVKGIPSSFPKWLDEGLRSKALFEKVFSRLKDVSAISFPEGNRPKQRELYNAILDQLDRRLNLDTRDIRNGIMELYEGTGKEGITKPGERELGGRKEPGKELLPWEVDDVLKPEPPTRGTSGLASIEDPTKRKSINKMIEERTENPDEKPPADFKISDRAKKILEKFGVAVGEKEVPRKLLGIFKPTDNKVRVQALYDLTTVVHETTHALDEKHGITDNLMLTTINTGPVRKSLTDLYEALYPLGKRTHPLEKRMREGLASLIENYFYNPASINELYPDLVNDFIKPNGRFYHPDITKLLEEANSIVADYSKLSPEARIGARIRTGEEVIKEESGFNIGQRFVFEVFNKFEPLKRYSKKVGVEATWDDPTVQAFNVMNKNTIILNWMRGESAPLLKRDGNFELRPETMEQYNKLIKGKEKEFESYLVARRVLETHNKLTAIKNRLQELSAEELITEENQALIEEGKKFSEIIAKDDFSIQDATAVVGKYQSEFAAAEKIYDAINKNLIDFALESDLIDTETAERYKNEKGYASFKRYIEDELDSPVGTVGSVKSKVSSFKERSGSKLDIISPIYNQMLAANEIISKGLENRLWERVAKLTRNSPELSQRFEKMDVQAAVDAKGRVSFPQEHDPNLIRVFKEGKRTFYKASPEFLAVAKVLRVQEYDSFVKLLQIPASVFTRLTTSANPFFALGNITIDQFSALTQTKTGFKPVLDPAKSLLDYIKGNPQLTEYLAVGGKRQTLAAYFDLSPEELTRKLAGEEKAVEKVAKVIDSSLGIFEIPSNTSEIITRFSEFKRAKEQGQPTSVAMYMASEITTPFQLSGNLGGRTGRVIVKAIPYFNAALQVLYKFGRTAKENPVRVATVGAGLTASALTLAIATMAGASDEQKRLLAQQFARNLARYLYIPSPDGKGLIRIRIPEQFGAITGMVYLFVISHYGANKATFDDYLESATAAIPDQVNITDPKKMILSWLPQAIKPSVETAANVRTFPNVMPIIPQYIADKEPKEQYTAYTSKFAKWLGETFNVSPALTDFWIREQFGAIGGMLIGKMPGIPVYIQEGKYVMSGRAYNNFYDKREVVTHQYQALKDDRNAFSPAERTEIVRTYKFYNAVADMLSDMRKVSVEKDLSDELKQGAYELLLNIDDYENFAEVRRKKGEVERLLNAARLKK